jgi:heptosyltransferase III
MKPQVVIYRFGQLGDSIAAIPAFEAIREHFAEHEITLLSESPATTHLSPRTILEHTGLIDHFTTYPKIHSWQSAWQTFRQLRTLAKANVSALVYLVPSSRPRKSRWRDVIFFRLCGFRTILGLQGFPENPYPRSATGELQPVPSETDALLERLLLSGIPKSAQRPHIDLKLRPEELTDAHAWLEQHGLSGPDAPRWCAVCPSAKWPSKWWPIENYETLGKQIIQELGMIPVIVGGREDQELAVRLLAHWGQGFSAAGQLGVRTSAALLSFASFYVGNDTGAMHLAAAVGTPCVAIFSAQDWPGRWNPLPVKTTPHRIFRSQVACAGCRLVHCPHQVLCLHNIHPESVFAACLEMANLTRIS